VHARLPAVEDAAQLEVCARHWQLRLADQLEAARKLDRVDLVV
jgi:hypothetical protein